VIAHQHIHIFECVVQSLHVGDGVVHGGNVHGRSVMMPVAQEYAGLTAVLLGLFYEPIHKCFCVIVVYSGIALQSKMDVSETGRSFKHWHRYFTFSKSSALTEPSFFNFRFSSAMAFLENTFTGVTSTVLCTSSPLMLV
jgi:hypothetical protein